MPSLRRARRLALLFAVVAPAHRAAAQGDGLTVVYRSTTTGSGALAAARPAGGSRMLAQGDRARYESGDTVPRPPLPARSVLLVLDGGKRTVVLDPARREYFTLDLQQMTRGLADMRRVTGTSTRIVDPDVRVEHVGPGEPILGQRTDRWRMTHRFAMVTAMPAAGLEMRMQSESTTEYWYGEWESPGAPPRAPDAMGSALESPELTRRIQEAARSLPPRLALRTVIRTAMSRDGVEMARSSTTSEVVELSRGPIPASAFEIPAGYREVPSPLVEMMRAAADTACATCKSPPAVPRP